PGNAPLVARNGRLSPKRNRSASDGPSCRRHAARHRRSRGSGCFADAERIRRQPARALTSGSNEALARSGASSRGGNMKDDLHCIELVARLGEYFEGAMSTEERQRFEVHMEHCIGCHRFFVQLGLLRKALSHAAVETDANEYSLRLSAVFSDWKKVRETRPR